MCACRPEEGIRSRYRWIRATMWLLGIELRTGTLTLLASEPSVQLILFSFEREHFPEVKGGTGRHGVGVDLIKPHFMYV